MTLTAESIFNADAVRATLDGASTTATNNVVEQLLAFERRLAVVREDRERMAGALEHIANVCKGSRQSTRRIRWIEARARSAIAGDDGWRDVDLPKHDPLVERLNTMVCSVYDIVKDEIAARRDVYEDDAGVVGDEKIGREIEILERFITDAKHNIEVIRNLEERGNVRTNG